ncbi:MAG: glycosyltransferase [Candidatus Hodarchaeota archaeon]
MNRKKPDVSLIMPCYNEESALKTTAPELIDTFMNDGIDIQLILVDNGSTDGTEAVIDEFIVKRYPVKKVKLDKNQGYGGGILQGLKECEAPIVGYLCADGQVSAEDALMTYRLIKGREDRTLTKVRRRFRQDSWKRKIVSIIYNGLMQLLYGWLGAIDINGSPKIFSQRTLEAMDLLSVDWFLDPEIIIKAKYLGLRIIEVDVEGFRRRGGASNVNVGTCMEFLKNIGRYRFGSALNGWKRNIRESKKYAVYQESKRLPETPVKSEIRTESLSGELNPLDGVRILGQTRYEDTRGFVQKMLSASQCYGDPSHGEVYVTSAKPGESKGNHYHKNMGEWFTVVQGEGEIDIYDPKSDEKISIPLGVSNPQTVYVPPGLAHSILNKGEDVLICVAWAEKEHDPKDVYPFSP